MYRVARNPAAGARGPAGAVYQSSIIGTILAPPRWDPSSGKPCARPYTTFARIWTSTGMFQMGQPSAHARGAGPNARERLNRLLDTTKEDKLLDKLLRRQATRVNQNNRSGTPWSNILDNNILVDNRPLNNIKLLNRNRLDKN